MKTTKQKLKIIIFFFIFILALCWNFTGFYTDLRLETSSATTEELDEIIKLVDNPDVVTRLEVVRDDLKFTNGICFED